SDQQVIPIHKKMFEARLGRGMSDADMAFFSTMKADRIQPFIQWMYSGIVSPQEEWSFWEIRRHFGIGDKEFYLKNGPAGLRNDMEKLYRNEQSKDFAILSGDRRIPVDRMVLSARTTLFRNMFREVKDGSNQVRDYSGLSFEALKVFVNYLYTDRIDETNLNAEIIAELKNTYEFFLAERNESDPSNPSSFIRKLTEVEEKLKSRLQMQKKDY
ncbi:MAG: BTB/POZ domain-containing protein, partial [Pseudomonadota bacterium]